LRGEGYDGRVILVGEESLFPTSGLPIELTDGERLHFDKAVLAAGARNRRVAIRPRALGGVFDLRTVEDADRIHT
jgi:NADPH-dependent 2,4-dienoyl-CoA reductase/sulfur reductase-like enzyme